MKVKLYQKQHTHITEKYCVLASTSLTKYSTSIPIPIIFFTKIKLHKALPAWRVAPCCTVFPTEAGGSLSGGSSAGGGRVGPRVSCRSRNTCSWHVVATVVSRHGEM